MPSEAEIRDVLARYRQAIHDKDAKAVVALIAADAVLFSMAPPLAIEAPTDPEGLDLWFGTWDGPVTQDTPDWRIVTDADCAVAYGLTRMSGRKVGGETEALWFRQTIGLTRRGGAWRIHHVHDSVPFAMDGSLKALVDLDPGSRIDPKAAVGAA